MQAVFLCDPTGILSWLQAGLSWNATDQVLANLVTGHRLLTDMAGSSNSCGGKHYSLLQWEGRRKRCGDILAGDGRQRTALGRGSS